MMRISVKRAFLFVLVGAAALGLAAGAAAQSYGKPSQPSSQQEKPSTEMSKPKAGASMASMGKLTAMLVDAEKKAAEKAATVKVTVTGVRLIDPASVGEKPRKGQGHLHYQVDAGPVIATTAPKLSFHELTPGTHKIVVMLANNDHTPAGPQQTLEVKIP